MIMMLVGSLMSALLAIGIIGGGVVMSAVEQQSQQDNILPDCMQDSPAEVSSHTDGIITAYLLYENQQIILSAGTATYVLVPGGRH